VSLPKIHAPIEAVEIGGERFEVRVITRAEQFRLQKLATGDTPPDELEIAAISMATDTPTDEVRDWYAKTPAWAVKQLVDHIEAASRLTEGAQKSGG
jgi:hypothetical protein